MNVNFITEVKKGNKYEITRECNDSAYVYESLARDVIAKKINLCTYIKSIKRIQLYNGFEKIIVTYDNNCRCTYTIESH